MAALIYRARLKASREFKRISRKPFATYVNPFLEGCTPPRVIHRCYHKVGTVWFARVLKEVTAHFGLSIRLGSDYSSISRYEKKQDVDMFLDLGSHVDLNALASYRGSHMIRDPRDLIVSAYCYHKWTDELWANLPRAELRSMSYKQYLNSLSYHEGLAAEIENSAFWVRHMAEWNFDDPNIYEITYEDIIMEEPRFLYEMFLHYGFTVRAANKACDLAQKYSLQTLRKRGGVGAGSHLRSGEVGEWKDWFEQSHKELFKEMFPGALKRLGYEKNDAW